MFSRRQLHFSIFDDKKGIMSPCKHILKILNSGVGRRVFSLFFCPFKTKTQALVIFSKCYKARKAIWYIIWYILDGSVHVLKEYLMT